jgi:hypothetical protein
MAHDLPGSWNKALFNGYWYRCDGQENAWQGCGLRSDHNLFPQGP